MQRTLYQIGADLEALDALLDECGGDITDPQVAAAVEAWYAELATDEAAKLDGYVGLVRGLEAEAAVARSEAEEYARRAQVREKAAARLKGRLVEHLQATGRTAAKTATGRTLAVQRNGGRPPVDVDDTPPAALPERYRRTVVTVDTDAVRADLLAGVPLTFARLAPVGSHLRIR